MLIPNPKKLIKDLNIAIDYWGKYKDTTIVPNYIYMVDEPYIEDKQCLISDLKSNIYTVFKYDTQPYILKYITTMIHYLCNEYQSNMYYVTPFEQLISFLDISQYLYCDWDLYLAIINILYKQDIQNKEYEINKLLISKQLLFKLNTYYIPEKEEYDFVLYFNLPVLYYALYKYELFVKTNDYKYLPIIILFRKLLQDYGSLFLLDIDLQYKTELQQKMFNCIMNIETIEVINKTMENNKTLLKIADYLKSNLI